MLYLFLKKIDKLRFDTFLPMEASIYRYVTATTLEVIAIVELIANKSKIVSFFNILYSIGFLIKCMETNEFKKKNLHRALNLLFSI